MTEGTLAVACQLTAGLDLISVHLQPPKTLMNYFHTFHGTGIRCEAAEAFKLKYNMIYSEDHIN